MAPELFHLKLLTTTPHLQLRHSRKVGVILRLTTQLPQPTEAEAALTHPDTVQQFLAMEVAERLVKDWIVVQQSFQTRHTANLLVLRKHLPTGLQHLPHYHIVSPEERLLAHRRIDTAHHQRLPVVHPAEHLLMQYLIRVWRLQRRLL